jgi:hypothetical protein
MKWKRVKDLTKPNIKYVSPDGEWTLFQGRIGYTSTRTNLSTGNVKSRRCYSRQWLLFYKDRQYTENGKGTCFKAAKHVKRYQEEIETKLKLELLEKLA